MTTDPQATGAKQETGQVGAAGTPERVNPEKVRVVDIEEKETGELIRRDCYDTDGGAAEMGDVLRPKDGELYLRAIDWARSKSRSDKLALQWEPTGLTKEEVGRIGVFTFSSAKPHCISQRAAVAARSAPIPSPLSIPIPLLL